MKRIVFDIQKCVACNACVVACFDQNDTDVSRGERPFRKSIDFSDLLEPEGRKKCMTAACVHCASPKCLAACPVHAIFVDSETGMVVIDQEHCIGCGSCAAQCPFDAIQIVTGTAKKCDGCYMRLKDGRLPACVRACRTGALYVPNT